MASDLYTSLNKPVSNFLYANLICIEPAEKTGPSRYDSRSLILEFRMFDRMYKADGNYEYDINEAKLWELDLIKR